MSDFDSGNSVNCVLLDINLYETKREKIIGPLCLKSHLIRMIKLSYNHVYTDPLHEIIVKQSNTDN